MSSEKWETLKFGSLYLEPSRNGLTRPRKVRGSGFKMINMGELFANDRIGDIEMERVPMSDTEIEKFSVIPLDLMFARQSMVEAGAGQCSIVSSAPEPTCFESHIIRVRLRQDICDPMFYYFYFRSPLGRSRIEAIVTGAAQKGIRGSELSELLVDYPPLSTQRRIAAALSAYDDLIENNMRRVAILEEIAQRLYEEWFVHFRFPEHEAFSMAKTKLGEIPDTWKIGKLGDLLEHVRNATKAGEHLCDREYVPIDCIARKSLALPESKPWTDAQSSLTLFQENDILFGAMRPYFHKVAIAPFPGVTRTTCFVLRAREQCFWSYAVLKAFSEETVDYASAHTRGATIPYAAWDGSLENFQTLLPPKDLLLRFDALVGPLLRWIKTQYRVNRNLRAQRDLLLPRLVAGEIDVSEIPLPEESSSRAA